MVSSQPANWLSLTHEVSVRCVGVVFSMAALSKLRDESVMFRLSSEVLFALLNFLDFIVGGYKCTCRQNPSGTNWYCHTNYF
jgi:hypothetical protein